MSCGGNQGGCNTGAQPCPPMVIKACNPQQQCGGLSVFKLPPVNVVCQVPPRQDQGCDSNRGPKLCMMPCMPPQQNGCDDGCGSPGGSAGCPMPGCCPPPNGGGMSMQAMCCPPAGGQVCCPLPTPCPPPCPPPCGGSAAMTCCIPINFSCPCPPQNNNKGCGGCGNGKSRREKRWPQCNFLKPIIDTRIYRDCEAMCISYAGHIPGEQFIHGRNLPTTTTFAKRRLCTYTPYEFVDPDGKCSTCTYP